MEIGQQRRQFVDVPALERAGAQLLAKQRAGREPAHANRIFQHRARAVQRGRPVSACDARDAKVQRRRQAPVQPDFLLAEVPPNVQRAVVHERQPHRLLDLVREIAGQHDPRDVSLDQLGVQRARQGRNQGLRGGRGRSFHLHHSGFY